MKIEQLLEDIVPTRQYVKLNRKLGHKSELDQRGILGKGKFSVARTDRDPHMVKKYNYRFDQKDPYNEYINYIIEYKLTDNPYFPRVYNIKRVDDPDGRTSYKYTVERLIPYTQLEVQELEAIVTNMFTKDTAATILNSLKFSEKLKISDEKLKGNIHSDMAFFIQNGLYDNNMKYFKDDNLITALREIRDIVNSSRNNLRYDMHAGNLMYRRTKYGAQPVISDPVA